MLGFRRISTRPHAAGLWSSSLPHSSGLFLSSSPRAAHCAVRCSSTPASVLFAPRRTLSTAAQEDEPLILERRTLKNGSYATVVTLSRPDKLNALDLNMFRAIAKAAEDVAKDRETRVVVLRGAGRAFCSGLDVKSIITNPLKSVESIRKLMQRPEGKLSNLAQDVGYLWRQVPAPVIAVTHGVCFGGGFQIALGADFRFSDKSCKFSIMEGKWGLVPDMSATITLRELVPIDVAKELTMTARIFDAQEAKSLGLVTKLCDDPFEEAMAFCETLSNQSPDAVAGAKQLFNRTYVDTSEEEALKIESELQHELLRGWNVLSSVAKELVFQAL
ncbi:enoyl-CoA hydratase [Guillardia theta CCMP2712]|uniref:Enoyl-CoA hydratase n=1 Tax=Guillardia theta (strain CCMP2712) TaxID=905079 RepID=L1JGA3_GUITC|nr:enoyl-CoA hydratase [Guillardia theta CCMP2712]EKX47174.1 enoyl-CoA hydratase [Guillardia theta CCMP2712]|eukprot:XP_005834154.1 enoyl-CoA hydratase [Guillardia theta CCMP2712]